LTLGVGNSYTDRRAAGNRLALSGSKSLYPCTFLGLAQNWLEIVMERRVEFIGSGSPVPRRKQMAPGGFELRVDWPMRQYVGKIIEYLARGGDHANAKMNMTERGIPVHVQHRVLEGNAVFL
jgi:hypothetical protein